MKKTFIYSSLFFVTVQLHAQKIDSIITIESLTHTISALAHDSMKGRLASTVNAKKSAAFIANRFREAGLHPLPGNDSFYNRYKVKIGSGYLNGTFNIAGEIMGKKIPDTIVVFTAYYDHIGMKKTPGERDSIYNGANDNASGVATLIELAKYYTILNNNRYTLIFVAFADEERMGFGSEAFFSGLIKNNIHAVINFYLMGRPVYGKKKCMVIGRRVVEPIMALNNKLNQPQDFFVTNLYTNYDIPDYGELQPGLRYYKNTFSLVCSPPKDPYHHTAKDEIQTLDFEFMLTATRNIARACEAYTQ